METVLVTGANGCIGSYVVDRLLEATPFQLLLLVRSPQKLREDVRHHPRVSITIGDLETMTDFSIASQADYVIHIATAWGDSDHSIALNVRQTQALFNACDDARLKRIIYFSTASILGPGGTIIPEAGTMGTGYIRSKYLGHQSLPKARLYDRIVTVFPTVVFGGDTKHPFSHISGGLLPNLARIRWLQFIYPDGEFQFLHAHDIAKVVVALLTASGGRREFVLGNRAYTAKEGIAEVCRALGFPTFLQVRVPNTFLLTLARWLKIRIHPWDHYCITHPHFVYDAVNPATFGLPVSFPTLYDVVIDIKTQANRH